MPAVESSSILVVFGGGGDLLKFIPVEVIRRHDARPDRSFECICGICHQPAVGYAKGEKGVQSLVPASGGTGRHVPGLAELPQAEPAGSDRVGPARAVRTTGAAYS